MKNNTVYTVGELAKMAGITVRTLQYYDRCGLLACEHSEGGRRIYGQGDLIRMQQIMFLKSYGFSLREIRDRLIDVSSGAELAKLLEAQRDAVACQIASLQQTTESLNKFIDEVRCCDDIGATKFVALVEATKLSNPYTLLIRYLSENQLSDMIRRYDDDESTKLQQKQVESIFSELLLLYKSGADPLGADGQRLAENLWKMSVDFSDGNPEMMKSLFTMGIDVNNWPDDIKDLRVAVSEFLSVAMQSYLNSHDVHFESFTTNSPQDTDTY